MKFIKIKFIKIKHWQAICVIIFSFLGVANIFSQYFEKNPMYVDIWIRRLVGKEVFYIEGLEIKIPENCAINSSKTKLTLIEFRCAITPKKLEEVDIRNSMFYNAEMFQKLKYYSEEFMEFNEYIYIVLGPKQGENIKFSLYYLKHQNIMITSESQVLAKKFADLLVEYDFQVKDTTPLYQRARSRGES